MSLDRRLLNREIKRIVEVGTGKPCYLMAPPEHPPIPYSVLYPIYTERAFGTYFDPNETRGYHFQVTSVGETADQAAAMSTAVHDAILGRDSNGNFKVSWNEPSINIVFRHGELMGNILQAGRFLYNASDTYQIQAEEVR